MFNKFLAFFLPGFLIIFSSCNLINPDEPIPSYLHIPSIVFLDSVSGEALPENAQKISDAWVFIDKEFYGTYELPVTFPVLLEGRHDVRILPGILANGIASTRIGFYYAENYDTTFQFVPAKIDTIRATTGYNKLAGFKLTEEFEGASLQLDSTAKSNSAINVTTKPEEVFQGSGSGKATLISLGHQLDLISKDQYTFANNAKPIILELNYRSDEEFTVGLLAFTGSALYNHPKVTVRASESWNKIYIDLSDIVQAYKGAAAFKLHITAEKKSAASTSDYFFDNIRLLY